MLKQGFHVIGGAIVLASTLAPPALAQTATGGALISEVVVTAQRREQRNVEVPASVVARSAEQLERANITSTMSLANVVPGLLLTQSGAPTAPTIRGVSTKVSSPGADPNVATYVDGFYQANGVALNRTLLDVAAVEVLRGPQGTLFGRNSTGGALLLTTRKPSHDPTLIASAAFEENSGQLFSGYGSIGVTQNLAVSLTGSWTKSDGWNRNITPGFLFPSAPKESHYFKARALYEPTDKVSVDFAYEKGMIQDGTGITEAWVAHPARPGVAPLLVTEPYTTTNGKQNFVEDHWEAGYLTVSWDLDFAVLKSMTQVRWDRSPWSFDIDGSPLALADVTFLIGQETRSEEVNLTSKGDGRLQWIVGGFFYHDDAHWRSFTPSGIGYGNATKAWAGYADATWQATDKIFLTAGVRYSEEKRHCLTVLTGGANGPLVDCLGGDPVHREHATTPRANIRYMIDEETSVYASYSRGFKTGGINDRNAAQTYDPEKLDAYEVGFKTAKADYSIDLSAFYYDYKGLQFSYSCVTVSPPLCNTMGTFVTNAAKATSYGAEGEVTWRANEYLQFHGGVAYLHARYDTFLNASTAAPRTSADVPPCVLANPLLCPNAGVAQDWSDQTPIRAPQWTANLGVTATYPTSVGRFVFSGNVAYTDKYQPETDSLPCVTTNCGRGLKPRLTEPSHTLVDATLSWVLPNEHLELSVYGRNLFDKTYAIRRDAGTLGDFVVWGEPRVLGARVKYTY
jgi:iron complex outermembrane receptor protein